MILIDFSQVSLSNILAFQRELKVDDEKEIKNLIRHVTISTLKSYKKKYGGAYGDLVICCDGRKYWRREMFSHYKASRKKNRENSDLNWTLIFDTLSSIRDEIKEHFPYKVLHFEDTEADDIIATMVEQTQELGKHEEVLIISSDKDFIQLHKYNNVKQWSPIQKKMVVAKTSDIKTHLIEHIVRGDSGDGIPNILSPNDVFVTAQRQKPITKKRLAEFFEKGIDACATDAEREHWERNDALINFERIPDNIKNQIINEFETVSPKGDKMTIMNYLIANRCNLLLDELEDF